jgi:hypothetical protein
MNHTHDTRAPELPVYTRYRTLRYTRVCSYTVTKLWHSEPFKDSFSEGQYTDMSIRCISEHNIEIAILMNAIFWLTIAQVFQSAHRQIANEEKQHEKEREKEIHPHHDPSYCHQSFGIVVHCHVVVGQWPGTSCDEIHICNQLF